MIIQLTIPDPFDVIASYRQRTNFPIFRIIANQYYDVSSLVRDDKTTVRDDKTTVR